MTIQQFIFNYTAAHQPARHIAYPDWQKVHSVLLICPVETVQQPTFRTDILRPLQALGKQVETVSYDHNQYNWLHRPKSAFLQSLRQQSYDLLIDLTSSPSLPLHYIALYARANFKIGAQPLPIYDMVIQPTHAATAPYTLQQMIHYLQTIKSAD